MHLHRRTPDLLLHKPLRFRLILPSKIRRLHLRLIHLQYQDDLLFDEPAILHPHFIRSTLRLGIF